MIVANILETLDYGSIFDKDISSYLAAVYVISSYDNSTDILNFKYYNSTPCENVFPDKNDPRLMYLTDYSCPDVPNIDDFFMPIQQIPG